MTNKKNQILDKSLNLFLEKGFEETSISDILKELEIARGTLYYHFESKEAIMDAIIERFGNQVVDKVTQTVVNHQLSVYEKFFGLFADMQLKQLVGGEVVLDYIHRPQNALFHEKSQQMILKKISPLLAQIIREGNEQDIFHNDFPDETAEMILLIIAGFMDNNQQENIIQRLDALFYNLEHLLGTADGDFFSFKELVI